MGNPSQDELYPKHIVLPKMTTAVRNSLAAEPGTLIYDTTQDKLAFSKSATVAAASWELITSVQEA